MGGWRPTVRRRLLTAGLLFTAWTVGIQARLVFLQVLSHDELTARADGQQSRAIEAYPKRGEILDRNGRILAYSVDGDAIYAVPADIDDPEQTTATLCDALACADDERRTILRRLSGSGPFAYVSRQVPPDVARRVAELDLHGVGFLPENRRYYPNGPLAAHVLGYVGLDNQGLGGIESTYDEEIGGEPGRILVQTDARRRAFSRLERPPTPGASLELTLDTYLQHVAERELARGIEERQADAGSVVVMDPFTGDVLALASWPTFNPNAFGQFDSAARRNRAIQDLYEPGSTFKIVTAAAALEEGIATRDELFDVSAGRIRVGRTSVPDMFVYRDPLTFDEVIIKSSNVGAIQIGLRVGGERLSWYTRRFGFGQALARDLPGQGRGLVQPPTRLDNAREIASVSMGYAVAVTPLQMAAAISSVANGGDLVAPRLVRAVIRNGFRAEIPVRRVRRAISAETAAELTDIMEGVVERGTARRAQVTGYRIAGKTGTAEKLIDGRYSNTAHNASFAGFVPARRPELTMIVMIDNPKGRPFTGGAVAAPVFQRIAEAALRYRAVPPTVNPRPAVLREPPPPVEVAAFPVRARWTEPVQDESEPGVAPDLTGLSARAAVGALGRLGLGVRLQGDGFVVAQHPAPGTPLDDTTVVNLSLERRRIDPEESS